MTFDDPMRKAVVWRLVFLVCFLPAGLCAGQSQRESQTGFRVANPFEQMRQRMALSSTGPGVPMEGAVDPGSYVVGPGDLFQVTIGGPEPVSLSSPVTADGMLILPEAGSLTAADRTLADVRRDALAALETRFRNVDLSVALIQPRQFYVHVTGAVPVPGRYPAAPVARVSSVLEIAFADTTQIPVTNLDFRPSLRNVTLRRRNGEQLSVDLRRYFATGETTHNPYLQDGDVISVPAYDPDYESVFVDGAVAFPGSYAYREGDTVLDLLTLTAGEPGVRGLAQVRLTRHAPAAPERHVLVDVQAMLHGTTVPPALQPLDHLYVIPKQREGGTVTIEGYVEYPGTYPIEKGRTTLRDVLLERAGGLRPEALARGAYLERSTLPSPRSQLDSRLVQSQLPGAYSSILSLRADSIAILRQMRLSELDFLSRTYYAQELRLHNRVPVNLEAILQGNTEPIYLQNGDRLYIPRDEQSIFVFGHVNRPGYIPYQPGRSGETYVLAAGGRGPLATNSYVVKAGTGEFLPMHEAVIESGDVIFIDREDLADSANLQRLLLEESRSRADARIRTAQTVLQLVATAATVVTTYLFVRNN